MEDLQRLTEKILATIQLDVNNMFTKAAGGVLQPEHQDALAKYYKLLTDARLAAKERELEEKISLAEEALHRGQTKED